MTSYFYTTKKGEVYELRMELNSERQDSEHDIFFLAYFDSVCRIFCSTIVLFCWVYLFIPQASSAVSNTRAPSTYGLSEAALGRHIATLLHNVSPQGRYDFQYPSCRGVVTSQ